MWITAKDSLAVWFCSKSLKTGLFCGWIKIISAGLNPEPAASSCAVFTLEEHINMSQKAKYTFLLQHYNKVNEYLSNENPPKEDFPDIVLSFCVVVEKILKIKLHKKNPILVFDTGKIKDVDSLSMVVLKKEKNIETSKIYEIARRFRLIFSKDFSEDEEQALIEIYNTRNHFVHSYKPDNKIFFDRDDLIKKMGTIWEKISTLAISLLGKQEIKESRPKKKYTEDELERVLENEVREMIKPEEGIAPFGVRRGLAFADFSLNTGEKCPRCGSLTLTLGNGENNLPYRGIALSGAVSSAFVSPYSSGNPNLYKCTTCNLELTEKQYGIAKKIKQSGE